MAIAVTAAFTSSLVRRYRLADWITASGRGVTGAFLPPVVVFGSLGSCAYLIIYVIMVTMTVRRSSFAEVVDQPSLLLGLLAAVLSAFFWASIGSLLGKYLRPELAVSLSLVVSYGAYVIPAFYLIDSPLITLMLSDGRVWLYAAPSGWQLVIKVTWWAAALLIIAGLLINRRRVSAFAGWVAVATVTMSVFIGSQLSQIPGSESATCESGPPRVCTDRAHAVALPRFSEVVMEGVSSLPPSLRPAVVDGTSDRAAGALILGPVAGNESPSMLVERDATLVGLGQEVFGRCESADQKSLLTISSLQVYWRVQLGIPIDREVGVGGTPWLAFSELRRAPEQGMRLAALPLEDRQAWFDQYGAAISECRLSDVRFP